MTREEAIQYNKNLKEYMRITDKKSEYKFLEENYIALEMAIKALEQEPSGDLISLEDVEECKELMTDINGNTVYAVRMSDIRQLPPVKPQEPKTGHWILSGGYWRCSNCNEKALLKLDKSKGNCKEYMPIKSNYCPNCGVKMVEPQKSEE